jgi:hypothetical protein
MMSPTLAWILLVCTLPCAFVVVVVASRKFNWVLWNLMWFWIMGQLGLAALQNPRGAYFGFIPALIYLVRAFTKPKRPEGAVNSVPLGDLMEAFMRSASKKQSDASGPSIEDASVIEAEFRRENLGENSGENLSENLGDEPEK